MKSDFPVLGLGLFAVFTATAASGLQAYVNLPMLAQRTAEAVQTMQAQRAMATVKTPVVQPTSSTIQLKDGFSVVRAALSIETQASPLVSIPVKPDALTKVAQAPVKNQDWENFKALLAYPVADVLYAPQDKVTPELLDSHYTPSQFEPYGINDNCPSQWTARAKWVPATFGCK